MHVDFPSRLVGIVYLESEVVSVLQRDRLRGHPRRATLLTVTPPSWRPDLTTGRGPRRGGRPHPRLRAHPVGPPDPAGRRRPHPRPAGPPPRRRRARRAGPVRGVERAVRRRRPLRRARARRRGRGGAHRAPGQPAVRRAAADAHPAARHHARRAAPQRRPRRPRRRRSSSSGSSSRSTGRRRPAPTEDVGIRPSDETLAAIRAAVPPQPRHVGAAARRRPGPGRLVGRRPPGRRRRRRRGGPHRGRGARPGARGGRGCRGPLPPRPLRPRDAGRRHRSSATSASCTPRWWRRSGCRPARSAASSTSTC